LYENFLTQSRFFDNFPTAQI